MNYLPISDYENDFVDISCSLKPHIYLDCGVRYTRSMQYYCYSDIWFKLNSDLNFKKHEYNTQFIHNNNKDISKINP